MRTVCYFLGAVALVAGMAFAATGYLLPNNYDLVSASALQISQVYSEAQFYILLAIAAFVMSGVFVAAGNGEVR